MKKMLKISPLLLVMVLWFTSSVSAADIPPRTYFHIQSAMEYGRSSGGVWDIPGKPTAYKRGLNIQVWDLPRDDRHSRDRFFTFKKVRGNIYEISNMLHPRSRVDVAGGKRRNGTNIGLWDNHNGKNQQFKMVYRGNGRWKIYPMIGGVVCLKSKSSKNGTNVHIWNDHNGPWTEWVLIQKGTRRAFQPTKARPVVRRPRENNKGVSLVAASSPNQGNITYVYFSKVNSAKFIAENNMDPLADTLNRLPESKRIILAKEIVRAIAKNPDSISRLRVYHQLDRANIFKSGNFLVKMVVQQLQKEVERNWRTEKNRTVKTVLFRMNRKF